MTDQIVKMFCRCCGFLLAGFLIAACDTESNTPSPDQDYFIKYYGGNGNQMGVDLIVNDDGTFLLLGNWATGSTSMIYLVKAGADGKIIWEKKLGSNDIAKDIEPMGDGNFVILSDYQQAAGNNNIKLIRINAEGEKIDSTVYGSTDDEVAKSVTPLSDGGFIVTGAIKIDTTNIPGNPGEKNSSDIFHYRCNSSYVFDETNWPKKTGSGTLDAGLKVIQNSTNEFYAFGYTNGTADSTLGKLAIIYYPIRNGEVVDPNYAGDNLLNTTGAFVYQVPTELGGGFFLAGTAVNQNQGSFHIAKLRSTFTGDPQFDKTLDINIDNAATVQLSAVSCTASVAGAQGYLVLGNQTRGNGTSNIWISKVDLNGKPTWSATFGSEDENDTAAAIAELPDGRILVLGTMGLADNQAKMTLIKVNSVGQLLK